MINQQQINDYHNDGVVFLPGLLRQWVDVIRAGIERNMNNPGPYAAENLKPNEPGRFFDDYCNWQDNPEFIDVIQNSNIAEAAASLMASNQVQLFHEHVLVKEPGTSKPTPWHQDSPYYFVEGEQTISFWVPVDHVTKATLRSVAGSHKWDKPVLPSRWLSEENFYPESDDYLPVPDPDKEPGKYKICEWEMAPGDAVAFNFKTLHGARGNHANTRRRAFSLRLLGDDARFIERPGKTSPPFPGHNMVAGNKLREDWFPVIWPK